MSSIVKARQLVNLPKMDNVKHLNEVPMQMETGRNMSEWIEKKEAIIKQALKKAKHIESQAALRAEAIVKSAIDDSQKIINEAEKRGYEEGYLRGVADGTLASEKKAEEGLLEFKRMVDCFRSEQEEIVKHEEKQLIDIALELSNKIMKHHVQVDEGAILKMLEEIIRENEESTRIYLSEYQKSLDVRIEKDMAKKIRSLLGDSKLVLLKEEDLIMAENEGGIVDMSVPTQLEQLKKAVSHTT